MLEGCQQKFTLRTGGKEVHEIFGDKARDFIEDLGEFKAYLGSHLKDSRDWTRIEVVITYRRGFLMPKLAESFNRSGGNHGRTS